MLEEGVPGAGLGGRGAVGADGAGVGFAEDGVGACLEVCFASVVFSAVGFAAAAGVGRGGGGGGGGGGEEVAVHAAEVLRVEVFAIKAVAGLALVFVGVFGVGWALTASSGVAAPDFEAEVLHAYVAGPFVLGAESLGAAVAAEDAGEGSGVAGLNVFVEGRY